MFEPHEILFIDDNDENIIQAQKMGIQTWLFDPTEDQLETLKLKMAQ